MNAAYGITGKFQVTIPKEIRDELGITSKDRIEFERRGTEIVLKKVPSLAEVSRQLQADLKRRGFNKTVTQADMDKARNIFYKQGGEW
ncbi:MAG TPA: AbrB/MazE/SpoVT family DNA-binding domain-containing protein [Candidatus Saccharimonadales bacterium]|jgi:AbrB family looped-hinge helix DNA binding protein